MLNMITLDGTKLNEFQQGKVSGIIWALTGMPEKSYAIKVSKDGSEVTMTFDCTDQQFFNVMDAINTAYPGVIIYKKD